MLLVYSLDFFCSGIQSYVLFLLHLLFISSFICSRRCCIDKLGSFILKEKSMCLDPHLN